MKAKEAKVLTKAYWDKTNDYAVVYEELPKAYAQIKANATRGMNWTRLNCEILPNFCYYAQFEDILKNDGKTDQYERMKERSKIYETILKDKGYELEYGESKGIALGKYIIVRW